MIKNLQTILLLLVLLTAMPVSTEASFASDALAKARAAMQGAFQLSFLHKLPVIFYKTSFDRLFAHANQSIDAINLNKDGRTITRSDFQDDKATHIKKSAELALHIKSLVGSAHLAYGITMVVGFLKEVIDSSFLNPNGSRSKEDLYADKVGAKIVFGEDKFNAALNKYLDSFVEPQSVTPAPVKPSPANQAPEPAQINPFTTKQQLKISGSSNTASTADNRQQLRKRYYQAAENGDTELMKLLGAELQKQP